MSIGSRIKERREQLHLSRNELADKINVTPSAIANYENEISLPKFEIMYRLFTALDCDANYLHQDEMKNLQYKDKATPEEFENIIRKYRGLDKFGRESVDTVLERETQRVKQLEELKEKIRGLEEQAATSDVYMRLIAYYGRIAAAGKSFGFEDIMSGATLETIETPENRDADYTIGVSGDSMEPTFYDGDIVFVKKVNHLDIGDIGIFQKDNCIYIKEVGNGELISRNPKYAPIPGEDVKIMGKVLGKVTGDYKIRE